MVAGTPATTRATTCIDQTSNAAYGEGGREGRMSRRTSSLRQGHKSAAFTAAAVLAALTWIGAALPASGAPLPEPDDPPPSQSTRSVKAPAPKTSTTNNTADARPAATNATPTPDAPIVATPTEPAPRPAPAPAPTTVTPVVPSPTPSAATTTVAPRAKPATTPKPKPRPKLAPESKRASTPPATATRTVLRPPHDVDRLGLPLARLVPVTDGESTRTALLVAAAVLLAASGAGSLTVGLSVRRLARGA